MSVQTRTIDLVDEAATLALGARLAGALGAGMRIYLYGELGTGKTTMVRGLLRALGYQGSVKSPTYSLVELYVISGLYLYHFDFYRFNDPNEWFEAGFDEYFDSDSVCLVEWPQQAANLLPAADLTVTLTLADDARRALVGALSARAESALALL